MMTSQQFFACSWNGKFSWKLVENNLIFSCHPHFSQRHHLRDFLLCNNFQPTNDQVSATNSNEQLPASKKAYSYEKRMDDNLTRGQNTIFWAWNFKEKNKTILCVCVFGTKGKDKCIMIMTRDAQTHTNKRVSTAVQHIEECQALFYYEFNLNK